MVSCGSGDAHGKYGTVNGQHTLRFDWMTSWPESYKLVGLMKRLMDHALLSINQIRKPITTCTYALHVFAHSTTLVCFDVWLVDWIICACSHLPIVSTSLTLVLVILYSWIVRWFTYLIWVLIEVKEFEKVSNKLTVEEIVGGIYCSQAPVRVVCSVGTEAKVSSCRNK